MKSKIIFLLALSPLALSSCKVYSNSYNALLLVTSNHGNKASMTFSEFEGQTTFKLKKQVKGEGDIKFTASLEEGKINVKYYTLGYEFKLFSINGGELVENHYGYIESSSKVTIIVTSEGKAINGNFTFDIN